MIDLSFRALFAHANGKPYAITTTFDGRDLVNGGMHMAVDVGNFGMDDPILSPITGRARGLYHYDGAIGIEYELGNGWTLQIWHLNATLAAGLSMTPGRSDVGDWVNVTRGQVCGRTGNTGAPVNGKPMPAHSHIELERNGQRYDVAPFLLGRPFDPFQEDDMRLPTSASYFVVGEVNAGVNLRARPETLDGALLTKAATVVTLLGIARDVHPYDVVVGGKTVADDDWYLVVLADGDVRWAAKLLVHSIRPTPFLFSQVPLPTTGIDPAVAATRIYEAADATARAARRHADGYRPS